MESEILAKAYQTPLFAKFNEEELEKYFRMMLQMKSMTNSLAHTQARSPKELAVLYKRFSINSQSLIQAVPLKYKTQYESKIKFLVSQIQDSENEYKKTIAKILQTE